MARKIAEQCPAFRVRQASRVLAKLFDDELRPYALQISQLPILAALAMFGESGASMTALAHALVMDRSTLTRSIQPLERAGLLRVARSPDDARARIVLLSPKGERLIESVFPVWERVSARIAATLGADLGDLFAELDVVIAMAPSTDGTFPA